MRMRRTPAGPVAVRIGPSLNRWSTSTILSNGEEPFPSASGISFTASAQQTPISVTPDRVFDNVWAMATWSQPRSADQFILFDAIGGGAGNVPASKITLDALVLAHTPALDVPGYEFSGSTSESYVTRGELSLTFAFTLGPISFLADPIPPQLASKYLLGNFVPPFAVSVEVSSFDIAPVGVFLLNGSDTNQNTFAANIPSVTAPVLSRPIRAKDRYFLVQNAGAAPMSGQVTFRLRF